MIAWLKDFFGLQDIRRDAKEWGSEKLRIGQTFGEKPCVVREEDRRRYSVSPGPPEIPEDLKRIAKWQPGELKRMSDKIIADVVEPILLREKENCRIEKALEFSRGYAEGQMAERGRCLFHAEDTILVDCLYQPPSNPHARAIAKLIRSGE